MAIYDGQSAEEFNEATRRQREQTADIDRTLVLILEELRNAHQKQLVELQIIRELLDIINQRIDYLTDGSVEGTQR